MKTIVGCDFHPRWQQVAVLDVETGEISEGKLMNGDGEVERFYASLERPALVGIEACGNAQWFIDLQEELATWCGSEMRRRSEPAPCAGRRPTGAMRSTFLACCWKTSSRGAPSFVLVMVC